MNQKKIKCYKLTGGDDWVDADKIQEREGAYAIIIDEDEVLMVPLFNGVYFFPGGCRETNESLEEALSREMAEECGIGFEVIKKLGITKNNFIDFEDRAWHAIGHFFLARALTREIPDTSKTREPVEGQALWVPLNEFDKQRLPEDREEFYGLLQQAIQVMTDLC